ncbi:MAG TPA: hypothetical protein VF559_12455 [Caulobacteraceae bacterium]
MSRAGASALQADYFSRAPELLYLGKPTEVPELETASRLLTRTSYFSLDTAAVKQVFDAYVAGRVGIPLLSNQDFSTWTSVNPKEIGSSLGDVFPQLKLIFIVRRPIDWVRSQYYARLADFQKDTLDGPNPYLRQQLSKLSLRSEISEIQFAQTFEFVRHNARAAGHLVLPHEMMVHQPREFLERLESFIGAPGALTRIFDAGEPPPRKMRINRRQASYIRTLGLWRRDPARFLEVAGAYGGIGPREHRQGYRDLAANPDAEFSDWERWFRRGRRAMFAALEREDERLLAALPAFDDYRIDEDLTAQILRVEQQETAALKARHGIDLAPFGYGSRPAASGASGQRASSGSSDAPAPAPAAAQRDSRTDRPPRKPQPVTIHIGLPSAGGLALQSQYFSRAEGVNYLGRGGADRTVNSTLRNLGLLGADHLDLADMRARMAAKVAASELPPLASVDTLSTWKPFSPQELGRRVAAVFGTPRVIFVPRRPTVWAIAHYQTRAIACQRDTFAGPNPWLEKHLSQLRVGSDLAAAQFSRTLESFCEGSGATEVLVAPYEEMERDRPAFLDRINGFLGLEGALAAQAEGPAPTFGAPTRAALNYARVLSLFDRERERFLDIADILGAGVPAFFQRRFQEVRRDPDATLAQWTTWFRNSQRAVFRAIARGNARMAEVIDIFPEVPVRPGLLAHLSEVEAEETQAMLDRRGIDLRPFGYLAAPPEESLPQPVRARGRR